MSLVVLAANPHQENVPGYEYQWRLSVTYQKLKQVTCTFAFSIPCGGDKIQYIDTEENIIYICTCTVGIGKKWQNRRRVKHCNYSPWAESGGVN